MEVSIRLQMEVNLLLQNWEYYNEWLKVQTEQNSITKWCISKKIRIVFIAENMIEFRRK